jgi:hypothetical protein
MDASIQDILTATLVKLGLPAPTNIIQTMLMKDRYFVGWKFRYDGGCVIMPAGGDTIEFYDGQGNSLQTVALKAEPAATA